MLRTLRTLAKHTPKPPTSARAAPAASPSAASSSAQQKWLPSTKRPKGAPDMPWVPAARPAPKPAPKSTPIDAKKAKRDAEARAKAEAVLQARRDAGAAKTDRTRNLLDSFRALSPNSRIILGLGFAAVGIAGLVWDSSYDGETGAAVEGAEGEKPVISVRMVDRK